MKKSDVVALVQDELLPMWISEREHLDWIDRWYRWKPEQPELPRGISHEHRYLLKLARSPWARLAVTTVAQMLFAEKVYTDDGGDLTQMWRPWQRNRMNMRQVPLHKAALAYGLAYTTALPGDTGAVLRAYSPREMLAVYGDPAEDEWPMYAMRVTKDTKGAMAIRLIDEEKVWYLGAENKDLGTDAGRVQYISYDEHDVGVCPVVRYANDLDLEGRAPGEVEPLIPIAGRINKTDYDRLLAQHFNSWKVRTATGLDANMSDADVKEQKLLLRQEDILVGDGETQFGTLDETPLDGFISARDADIEAFAAVSQTPPTTYGKLTNVSAEGLVEARASLYAKRDERKVAFGSSHEQMLRLAAHIEGRAEDADDFSATIGWADTEARTLNQAVDALGKAAQMLGVPAELLWELIPGISKSQADYWREYARQNPDADMVQALALSGQLQPNLPVEDPTDTTDDG